MAKRKVTIDVVTQAFVDAYTMKDETGNLVTQCVTAANAYFHGHAAEKDEIEQVAGAVVDAKGWEDKTAKSRRSEIRAVLRTYDRLTEACEKARTAVEGSFTWHHAISVARKLSKKDATVQSAVDAFVEAQTAKSAPIASAAQAKGAIASHVKRIRSTPYAPKKFVTELEALCEKYNIKV